MNSKWADGRMRWRVKRAHICDIYIPQDDSCFFAARCNLKMAGKKKKSWICKKVTDGCSKRFKKNKLSQKKSLRLDVAVTGHLSWMSAGVIKQTIFFYFYNG